MAVAVLTFIAHHKLPYRRMLVLTGVLLGVVLLVMVGEEAQEMQLAHWLPATKTEWLENFIPPWMGLWFGVSPTMESLAAQVIAATLVVGSYYMAKSPAREQRCDVDCKSDAPETSGADRRCDPFCVSATVCQSSPDPQHPDSAKR